MINSIICTDPEEKRFDWDSRVQIALGVARGMDHLHASDPPILYGNLKPSKIVLDEELKAKLLGFGFSEFEMGAVRPYGEPQYVLDSKDLVPESDVFSVGIFLLELMTGQLPLDVTRDPQLINDWVIVVIVYKY